MRESLSKKDYKLQHVIESAVHSGLAITHALGDEQMPFFHNANTPADLK
jgi:hypothetical protein